MSHNGVAQPRRAIASGRHEQRSLKRTAVGALCVVLLALLLGWGCLRREATAFVSPDGQWTATAQWPSSWDLVHAPQHPFLLHLTHRSTGANHVLVRESWDPMEPDSRTAFVLWARDSRRFLYYRDTGLYSELQCYVIDECSIPGRVRSGAWILDVIALGEASPDPDIRGNAGRVSHALGGVSTTCSPEAALQRTGQLSGSGRLRITRPPSRMPRQGRRRLEPPSALRPRFQERCWWTDGRLFVAFALGEPFTGSGEGSEITSRLGTVVLAFDPSPMGGDPSGITAVRFRAEAEDSAPEVYVGALPVPSQGFTPSPDVSVDLRVDYVPSEPGKPTEVPVLVVTVAVPWERLGMPGTPSQRTRLGYAAVLSAQDSRGPVQIIVGIDPTECDDPSELGLLSVYPEWW